MLALLKVLLLYKPRLDIKGKYAGTALWEAQSAQKYPQVVRELIRAGCDLHIEHMGYTPFQKIVVSDPGSKTYEVLYAAEKEWAKKSGYPFPANLPNEAGNTVLHMAAAGPEDRAVQNVLTLPGVDVNARNLAGRTPLFMAMHLRGAKSVKRLLDEEAATDVVDYQGNSVLDCALTAAPVEVIAAILQRPCSIEAPWDMGQPEVRCFAEEPWFEHLQTLILQRTQRDDATYGISTSAQLDGRIVVHDYQEDKSVLAVPIPKEMLRVQRVVFTFRSRDQGTLRLPLSISKLFSRSGFNCAISQAAAGKRPRKATPGPAVSHT